jgi:hypothetical protein
MHIIASPAVPTMPDSRYEFAAITFAMAEKQGETERRLDQFSDNFIIARKPIFPV